MAISQNCLLTTPSLAVVTSSLFCPPQQRSLSSLGRGQRRLCQPRGAPHPAQPHAHPRTRHGTQQVLPARLPAHLWGCQPAETPLLEKDLPVTHGNDCYTLRLTT